MPSIFYNPLFSKMIELDTRQTLIVAILVLFLGRLLVKKIPVLDRNNIPEPVVGGVAFSLLSLFAYLIFGWTFTFDMVWRDTLLIVFFTCIGVNSDLRDLIKGGKVLVLLTGLTVSFLFVQNAIGVGTSMALGIPKFIGLLTGSISLSGGHGTAIAWGKTLAERYDVSGAMEIGAASATFGLVMGGVLGGPLAHWLIDKYRLKGASQKKLEVGVADENDTSISAYDVFNTLLVVSVAMGLGFRLKELLDSVGIPLPGFVSCLFCGILLTNTIPLVFKKVHWPTQTPALALLTEISLGLFLAMSLMSLQLWTLAEIVGPMLLILLLQVIAVVLFSFFVIFKLMGKNYDAAVIISGFIGFTMGATPTALVNMTAVTKKSGPSPIAFLTIPLIGAFFLDLANSIVITFFLSLF